MNQLLVFKFEGAALLIRLAMLIMASPVLWLVDVINFSIDAAKSVNKKKLVLKTILLVVTILAVIQVIENACGELNELYFELLKVTFLGFKIISTTSIYMLLSVSLFCLIMMFIKVETSEALAYKISSSNISYLLDEICFIRYQQIKI